MNDHRYERYIMPRSKKSSIAIISALTLFVEFLSNVFKFLKKIGGNEEIAYSFFSSPDGAKELAELIFSKTKIVIDETKKLIQPLSDFITSLKLDWVNENITEANFPIQPEDLIETEKEFKEFHFGKTISSENVITEMNKENFRPATTREQLKWALKNWDGKSIIVALGQTWLDSDSSRGVSVLRLGGGGRGLGLGWSGGDWRDGYRFLGVRK